MNMKNGKWIQGEINKIKNIKFYLKNKFFLMFEKGKLGDRVYVENEKFVKKCKTPFGVSYIVGKDGGDDIYCGVYQLEVYDAENKEILIEDFNYHEDIEYIMEYLNVRFESDIKFSKDSQIRWDELFKKNEFSVENKNGKTKWFLRITKKTKPSKEDKLQNKLNLKFLNNKLSYFENRENLLTKYENSYVVYSNEEVVFSSIWVSPCLSYCSKNDNYLCIFITRVGKENEDLI